mgnify:CR=1 FL=1
MTKREQHKYQSYRELHNAHVEVAKSNQIEFNSGSETIKHAVAKLLVGYIGHTNGYWVSSEVDVPQGEIDVLLWGHESRLTYAVEVETGWTDTTLYDKTERYVHSVGPIDDIVPIEVTEMPINMIEATEWISEQLGLTL